LFILLVQKSKQNYSCWNKEIWSLTQFYRIVLSFTTWHVKNKCIPGWRNLIIFGLISLHREHFISDNLITPDFIGFIFIKDNVQFHFIYPCSHSLWRLLQMINRKRSGYLVLIILIFGDVTVRLKWVTVLM